MDWVKFTKAAVTVTILVIGIYDVIALYFGGVEATISRTKYFFRFLPSIICFIPSSISSERLLHNQNLTT